MASLYKRDNGYYYAAFYDPNRRPQRKQVALKTKDKREARRTLAAMEAAFEEGREDPWAPRLPEALSRPPERPQEPPSPPLALGAAVDAFVASRAHYSPETVSKYHYVLGGLVRHAGAELPLTSVTADTLADYLAATPRRPVTKRSYAKAMGAMFNWLIRLGALAENPADAVPLERVPSKHPRFLTEADVEAVCRMIEEDAARPHVADGSSLWLLPIVRANVYLGMRAGEVVNLRWEHVDLAQRTLVVACERGFTTKGGKERTLPLSSPVLDVLEGLERETPWVFPNASGTRLHRKYLSRRFKHFVRRAGLAEHVTFHTTRHTCASWLAQRGAPVEAIRLYLGHSSIAVTEKYMHLSPSSLAQHVASAFEH